MQDLKPLQRWLLAFAMTAVAVVLSYYWIDRPLAQFAHAQTALSGPAMDALHVLETIVVFAMASTFAGGLWIATGHKLSRLGMACLLSGFSVGFGLISDEVLLKPMFGRTWPEAFLHNSTYGFHLFHGGHEFGSFPSGHTCFVSSALLVFWILYPRSRPFVAFAITAVIVSLVLVNDHFFGDTLGGLFVGATAAWLTVTAWRASVTI